jgi:uncharacterized membrane protein
MTRSTIFWVLALVITLASAYYQRTTGPTYPLAGKTVIAGKTIKYALDRSHGGESNAVIGLKTDDASIGGVIEWKRYKTDDAWTPVQMKYDAGTGILSAELPHQPPAGKLEYKGVLHVGNESIKLPAEGTVVIRYKGDVPAPVLIPHIIAMFVGMLFAARALLACFNPTDNLKRLTDMTVVSLFIGGMVLGPLVQHYAFDAWWTGWPFATDLTDNKTAIALLAWIIASIAVRKSSKPKLWVAAAFIVMFVVYLIPHSMFGSELKYENTPKTEITNGVK